jgi:hypothetical protein
VNHHDAAIAFCNCQRVEAEVKTTMQLSPRQPAFQAVHLFVTVSIGRKVWLFAKQSN